MAARYSLKNHLLPSLFLFLSLPIVVTPITSQELDIALSVLRRRGYNLISNAIATSDFRADLLSTPSFTFFAPPDSSLFSFDMTLPSHAYRSILRTHAVPTRLSAADLRRRRPSSSIPTFLRSHSLRITFGHRQRRHVEVFGFSPYVIIIDGVNVTSPGLYYGRNVAVHGLGGVLNFRSRENRASRNNSNPKTISHLPKFQHPNQMEHKSLPGHKNGSRRHGKEQVPNSSPPPLILGHPTNSVTASSISPDLAPAYLPISVGGTSPDVNSTLMDDKNNNRGSKRRGYRGPMMPRLKDDEDGEAGDQYRPWDQRIDYLDVVRFWNEDPPM